MQKAAFENSNVGLNNIDLPLQRLFRIPPWGSHKSIKQVEKSLNKASKSSRILLYSHGAGCLAKFFCEHPTEIFGVIEAHTVGDVRDGTVGVLKERARFGQAN